MALYNDKLYENILDGIKRGLKSVFMNDLYTDHITDEDERLNDQIEDLKQQIRDLFNKHNRFKPLYIDLLSGGRQYFYSILNRKFKKYDVQGYKPPHIRQVILDKFFINPRDDYKFITFENDSTVLSDFINKKDVIDLLRIVLKIVQVFFKEYYSD